MRIERHVKKVGECNGRKIVVIKRKDGVISLNVNNISKTSEIDTHFVRQNVVFLVESELASLYI